MFGAAFAPGKVIRFVVFAASRYGFSFVFGAASAPRKAIRYVVFSALFFRLVSGPGDNETPQSKCEKTDPDRPRIFCLFVVFLRVLSRENAAKSTRF